MHVESASAYVVCPDCRRRMTPGTACTVSVYKIGGQPFWRLLYGTEMDGVPPICHDCCAPVGGLHHPGCDVERCPRCSGQSISCDCPD
jgi:hypothetical protein